MLNLPQRNYNYVGMLQARQDHLHRYTALSWAMLVTDLYFSHVVELIVAVKSNPRIYKQRVKQAVRRVEQSKSMLFNAYYRSVNLPDIWADVADRVEGGVKEFYEGFADHVRLLLAEESEEVRELYVRIEKTSLSACIAISVNRKLQGRYPALKCVCPERALHSLDALYDALKATVGDLHHKVFFHPDTNNYVAAISDRLHRQDFIERMICEERDNNEQLARIWNSMTADTENRTA